MGDVTAIPGNTVGDPSRRQFHVTLRTERYVVYLVEAPSEEEATQSWEDGEEVDWSDQLTDEVKDVIAVEEVTRT